MPMCLGFLSVLNDTEVLAYSDMVMYIPEVKGRKPFTSDKLSVCHQMGDVAFSCKSYESGNKVHLLLGVVELPR